MWLQILRNLERSAYLDIGHSVGEESEEEFAPLQFVNFVAM